VPPYPAVHGFNFVNSETFPDLYEFLATYGNSAYICVDPIGDCDARIPDPLYWLIWFVSIPLLFACVMVWALTPPSGVDQPGVLGWIQSAVREQPVPVGIGCFAIMEMALGAVRRRLPLSKWAYPPLREDLPPKLRSLFERAAALLDEAEQIQTLNEKAVVRELSSKERKRLAESLDTLRTSMRVSDSRILSPTVPSPASRAE